MMGYPRDLQALARQLEHYAAMVELRNPELATVPPKPCVAMQK
jgi:hypothetical protein